MKNILIIFSIIVLAAILTFMLMSRRSALDEVRRDGDTLEVPIEQSDNGAPPGEAETSFP